jgi:hypothetical protein
MKKRTGNGVYICTRKNIKFFTTFVYEYTTFLHSAFNNLHAYMKLL